MSLLLCLFSVSLGRYCQKNLAKSGGFGKKNKQGMAIWTVAYRRGIKSSAHYGKD